MGFRVSEPKKAIQFEITVKHCEVAKRKDPCECVIAQSFYDKFKEKLSSIHVLSTITTLIYPSGLVHRYRTPPDLRNALEEFDKTGLWNLEPGTHELLPLPRSQTSKAQAARARIRRADGDENMSRKYPYTGKQRRRNLDPRKITLRGMRAATAVK